MTRGFLAWLLEAEPRERHITGLGGSWSALIAALAFVTGLLGLAHGDWLLSGVLFVAGAIGTREAYMRYRAGNWP